MDKVLRDRDVLWCRALVAVLNIGDIAKVTAEFNRIRPEAAQPSAQAECKLSPDGKHYFMPDYHGSSCSYCGKVAPRR